MRTPALPWLALGMLVAAAFTLGCFLVPPPGLGGPGGDGVGAALLSSARVGFASGVFDEADLYLHRGVGHVRHEAFHETWFQRTAEALSPRAVVHREGSDSGELVPWLWLTVRLDPTNTEYVLVAAYWLDQAGHPDLALKTLEDAQARMPREPRLHLERARLHLHAGRLDQAARALNAGIACAAPSPANAAVRSSLLLYRGLLSEAEGQTDSAIADYREALSLSPAHHALAPRLQALLEGRATDPSASSLLHDLSRTSFQCSHDGDEHSRLHAEADEEHDEGER